MRSKQRFILASGVRAEVFFSLGRDFEGFLFEEEQEQEEAEAEEVEEEEEEEIESGVTTSLGKKQGEEDGEFVNSREGARVT
jgi:hypothetical protein